jgi:hypothetical protein
MSVPTDESRSALITDLEIEGQPFLRAPYWRNVVDGGLDAVYTAYTQDVREALGDWSHICRIERGPELYVLHARDRTIRLPRTDWSTMRLRPGRARPEQLLVERYRKVLDGEGRPRDLDPVPELRKPSPTLQRRRVPSWTGALVTGEFMVESDTVESVDVPRERLVALVAEGLALNPVAIAELELLCEFDERLAPSDVRFVEK